ncbi:MAG: hypothetical protein ACLPUO_19590 [Streptosporangiaceae bacterium]|jgi:hypothetical protein
MSAGTIAAIVIVIVIVVAAAQTARSRRRKLQERFGPEYNRAVEQHESRRQAETELAARERRVRDLDIRPLDPAARTRYAERWALVQEQFVETPGPATVEAHALVITVMRERGYPTDDPNQMAADLSVEHAATLDHYRLASAFAQRASSGAASTEELRQAMLHYRALFQDLLGVPESSVAGNSVGTASTTAGTPAMPPSAEDAVPAGPAVPAPDQPGPEAAQARPAGGSAPGADENAQVR